MRVSYNPVANDTSILCEDVEITYVILWSLYSTEISSVIYQKNSGEFNSMWRRIGQ